MSSIAEAAGVICPLTCQGGWSGWSAEKKREGRFAGMIMVLSSHNKDAHKYRARERFPAGILYFSPSAETKQKCGGDMHRLE